ncbi:MAG: ATP-dependent zinc metalloprotease FtsH [Fibrobacterales bacterium]
MQKDPMNSQNKKPEKPPVKNKNLMLVLFMVILAVILLNLYSTEMGGSTVSRTEFLKWMSDPEVIVHKLKLQKYADGVNISGRKVLTADERTPDTQDESFFKVKEDQQKDYREFTSHMLEVPHDLIIEWEKNKNIHIEVMHDTSGWISHLFTFIPLILIIAFFWFMMARQGGGQGGRGLFSMGKSRAKLNDGSKAKQLFSDVAGCEEAKEDLQEIVDFLKSPKKYNEIGAKIPKGALLLGPPGTGKTLLARAVAGEAGVPFFSVSGSDFVEMFVGVGASRVRDLFETGKKNAPCILFIDEIDAVGRQRGAGLGGGHDEREQTLNQLLVEMDGFDGNEGVILIAATNRADVLDKALLRPGRFDRQIVVDAPDVKGRKEILEVHLKKRKTPLADDIEIETLAKGTPGLTGADLENLINEASLLAARFNAKTVSMLDFEEAKDKIMIGTERRSRVMTDDEKRTTAYHEAGHALITHLMENADTLHKLSIIPRGRALGITFSLPEKDRYTMDKLFIQDQIAILLAGRSAEHLVFNQRNTGASNDIERASELARRMTTEWGMTDELGPICYGQKQEEVFLGRDIQKHQGFSEQTSMHIDEVVRSIIDEQMHRVDRILEENRDTLTMLAEALLEHEVLDREEILNVLDGNTLESSKKSRQYQKMLEEKEKKKEKELAIENAIDELQKAKERNAGGDLAIDVTSDAPASPSIEEPKSDSSTDDSEQK